MNQPTNTSCNCKCSCAGNKNVLPESIIAFMEDCKKKPHSDSYLIAVLHKAQDYFGFLSPETMDAISAYMQIPAAKVSGVASFYHYFRLTPRGKFPISVCLGTACYVKGAEDVVNKFSEELGIKIGETTSDGLFSLEIARCIGACALAPVVKIGEVVHSAMLPDQVPAIIAHYIALKDHE